MTLLLVSFISLFLLIFSACPKYSLSGSCTDSTYSLMTDGKVCTAFCSSKFTKVCTTTSGSTVCTACSLPTSPILFQLNFWTVQDLTKNYIANALNPSEHFSGGSSFSSISKSSPLPIVDRGFYFAPPSSLGLTSGYYAALYFTLNIWIRPLAAGQIFTFFYNSGYYIECIVGSNTFILKVLLLDSNDSNQTKVTAYSNVYTTVWQTVSFQLEQASCNQVNLKFYMNSSPTVTSFYNYEVNYPIGC
ncbi:unnamed protein product [Blepharisma stoltei]|uniref:Uncharacterized protein n=1 Tax=Blepharisma stoltei TaxID=1481888 RepID=A0AAU9J3A3_9CILI|nr:unnamed protein product [Blepharisma stoltei]